MLNFLYMLGILGAIGMIVGGSEVLLRFKPKPHLVKVEAYYVTESIDPDGTIKMVNIKR